MDTSLLDCLVFRTNLRLVFSIVMVFYSDLRILIYRVLTSRTHPLLLYIYVSHACTVYTDTEAEE